MAGDATAVVAPMAGEYNNSNRRASTRFIKGGMSMEPKPANIGGTGVMAMVLHPLNLLLVAFPAGVLSHVFSWGDVATFWLNFTALIPLAKILGDATEELAAGLKNDMLAGLLNATFGNAVEMVIMVQTLRKGYTQVVKATLLGSVLSNLLLVLGMSFFFGGIIQSSKKRGINLAASTSSLVLGNQVKTTGHPRVENAEVETYTELVGEKVQTFSVMSALVNTSMLLLSCLSFSLVTVFASGSRSEDGAAMDAVLLPVSRICSVIIAVAYGAYVFFQLVTHREAMAEDDDGMGGDEAEEPALSVAASVLVMCLTTCFVAFSSEFLVSSLEGVVEHMGISRHFIGIILLPIVGNACEHASAIRFAIMDKTGLSIGIAVGSSTQIALFVVPFAVIVGWIIQQPMDLDFGSLNTTVMSCSVVVVLSIVVDGKAHWLQGYLLMSAYLVVAVLYWHLPELPD